MSAVIKVENISKQYRLGDIGTGALSHDINRWWHRIRGKEDPYLKIGETNDRSLKSNGEYVWALRNINFEVNQGDVLGIIGRNGAGKSTLLKILSRTTAPTTGCIKIKGRVASLLEVGTGFHPELTGRENIYLNGAILGMTRKEISRKFDEIVDFAGVERYIDTPVKRYSSGMYVRLAFAVAAHLEPEILIVDEVLAVGDAEFQKKCLGKMKEVSVNEGRTVLFVSHNMEAVSRLCNVAILLQQGSSGVVEPTPSVIRSYLDVRASFPSVVELSDKERPDYLSKNIYFKSISFIGGQTAWSFEYRMPIELSICFEVTKKTAFAELGVTISTLGDTEIITSLSSDVKQIQNIEVGVYTMRYTIHKPVLIPNTYKLGLGLRTENGASDFFPSLLDFTVVSNSQSAQEKTDTRLGVIVPEISISIES